MVLLQHNLLRNYSKFGLLLAAFILFTASAFSQSFLEVPVKLDIEKGTMEGVLVKVKKEGKDAFTQSGSSKMRLKLDYNKRYTLIFTKDGYVTKTIEFDTHAPSERIKDGFEPYAIGVKLFEQESDKHTVVYNQAVGLVKYDSILDEFGYDTDYSKSILSDSKEKEQPADSIVTPKSEEPQPVAQELEKKPSKSEEKAALKKQKEEEKLKKAEETAKAQEKAKAASGNIANDVPPTGSGSTGNDVPPAPSGNGGNDVPSKPTGNGNNDVASKPSGNGGNDNSGLTAMVDGGDVGGGIEPSSGSESIKKATGSSGVEKPSVVQKPKAGNERPSITQMPKSGSESNKRQPASDNGNDNMNAPVAYESQSITREDIVEDKRIITVVKVTKRNTTIEYRRVTYRWGGPFYFIDNKLSISETVFAFYTGVKD
ncbi:MAG: hypothetical protein ABI772_08620 [Bacteroidota bacterium]